MSYGLKYFGEAGDYFSNLFRVELYERDYSGANSEMEMTELNLDYPGDEFDIFRPVYGSQMSIGIISTVDFQYIGLHTADARKFRVDVLKAGVLFWRGWLIPDLFSEPYIAPPYNVRITARCGLGELENIPMPGVVLSYGDGAPAVIGKTFVNLYSVLKHIFGLLGLDLEYRDAINIYNAERSTPPIDTDTTLTDTYVDLTQYSKLTIYEFLADTFRTLCARLYQKDGYWYGVRMKEYRSEIRIRTIDFSAGSISFATVTTNTFLIGKPQQNYIVNNGPELRINPAWKQFVLKSIKEKRKSILLNHDFNQLEYMQLGFAGARRNEYRYDSYPVEWIRFASVSVGDNGIRIEKNTNNLWRKYIYQEVDIEATEYQALKIKINCAPIVDRNIRGVWPSGSGAKTSFAFGLLNKHELNVRYLYFDDYGFSKWETSSNVIVVPDVETIGYQQDNVKTFELIAKGIPLSGKLGFSLFGAQGTSLLVQSVEITIIEILNPDEPYTQIILRDFEENVEETVIVNPNNSYIPSPIEIYGGDLPDRPNVDKIYNYGYREASGARTKRWHEYGELAEIQLIDHLKNNYRSMYSLPQWVLQIPILSENISFDSAIVDYQVINKKYICTSASWDLINSIFSGIFAEIGAWEGAPWILDDGEWNDEGIWVDGDVWNDT